MDSVKRGRAGAGRHQCYSAIAGVEALGRKKRGGARDKTREFRTLEKVQLIAWSMARIQSWERVSPLTLPFKFDPLPAFLTCVLPFLTNDHWRGGSLSSLTGMISQTLQKLHQFKYPYRRL